MSIKSKTIPYVMVGEKRDPPFTMELELASLFTIAETHRGQETLSAMARVYYPLRIHRWDGGVLLIDMLGLNHTSIGYNIIPHVEEFKRALADASEDQGAFEAVLRKSDKLFKEFAGRKTVKIDGLLVPPKKEVGKFLMDICDFKHTDGPVVFEPVLKSVDIESITDTLRSLRRDIEKDLRDLERAKGSLRDALHILRKVVEEEIGNIRDGSAKVKTKIRGKLKKTKRRCKRVLESKLNKVRKKYKKQAAPFTRERRGIKRKLARRRRKLEKMGEGRSAVTDGLSREIAELDAKLEEEDGAIRSLRALRDAEVEKARAQYRADIKVEADKIKEEEALSREAVLRKKAEISGLEEAAKGVVSRIDRLIRSKKGKLDSLSRFSLEVGIEATDLYIPFYIFRYGKKFDFYPPVEVPSSKGIISRFKRALAENLPSRMALFLKPRAEFIEKYLAKAVRAPVRNKGLVAVDDEANLLRSHSAIDKMMMGLVKMRLKGWIGNGDYIRLHEALIENRTVLRRRERL